MLFLLAQTTSTPAPEPAQSPLGGLLIFVPLILAFYFFAVRPNQRRMRAQQALMASVQPGDEIETAGGMLGIVREADDQVLHVELSPGVVVRLSRGAVRRKVGPDTGMGGQA